MAINDSCVTCLCYRTNHLFFLWPYLLFDYSPYTVQFKVRRAEGCRMAGMSCQSSGISEKTRLEFIKANSLGQMFIPGLF